MNIMNTIALLFTLGFTLGVIGFVKAQILTCRFITCYYLRKNFDCDLLKLHAQGAYAELAMLGGFLLALIMGIIQVSILGSWLYLLLCAVAVITVFTTSYLFYLLERKLADKRKHSQG